MARGSTVRFKVEYEGAKLETLRFSELKAFVEALAAAMKVFDPTIDPDRIVPVRLSGGSHVYDIHAPSGMAKFVNGLTKDRRRWTHTHARAMRLLQDFARRRDATILAASVRGKFRPIIFPTDGSAPFIGASVYRNVSRVLAYVERSGGAEPTAQLLFPNSERIHPKVRTRELAEQLAKLTYRNVMITLDSTHDIDTGEAIEQVVTDFELYAHTPLADVVAEGRFKVDSGYKTVNQFLADREAGIG